MIVIAFGFTTLLRMQLSFIWNTICPSVNAFAHTLFMEYKKKYSSMAFVVCVLSCTIVQSQMPSYQNEYK